MLSAGRTEGLQKTEILDGIGPIVVMVSVSACRSVAAAVMVVVPALYVVEKVAEAYTFPVGTARVDCTLPTFSSEEVSWIAMGVDGCGVIFPPTSNNWMATCWCSVLSARVLGGATCI